MDLDFLKYPIVQAPMAGITTPEMVIESCKAGILGSIGAGYLSVAQLQQQIRQVKAATEQPFMVNLFAHEIPAVAETTILKAKADLMHIFEALDIRADEIIFSKNIFQAQLDVVIAEGVQICSFTFGLPTCQQIAALKAANITILVTATSLEEMKVIEHLDIDGVILQGAEAGGHRGSFIEPYRYVPLNELVNYAKSELTLPFIVAGGIATKQQMDNYLSEGAVAVVIGSLFVVSEESNAPVAHKEAILRLEKDRTVYTKAFSGKVARGIQNIFVKQQQQKFTAPFPLQNDLTKSIRAAAAMKNEANYMSLWAGTSAYLAKPGTVKQIVERFMLQEEH